MGNKGKDTGLLIIRLVIGISMIAFHGIPKIVGGVETWEKIGGAMGNLGISFFPVFWGLLATLAESLGAVFFTIGLWTKPSSAVLAFTMIMATVFHLAEGHGLAKSSHTIELLAVFVAFCIMGAGRYSVDKR